MKWDYWKRWKVSQQKKKKSEKLALEKWKSQRGKRTLVSWKGNKIKKEYGKMLILKHVTVLRKNMFKGMNKMFMAEEKS